MVVALYDHYVALQKIIEEWEEELKEFIKNYSFPCRGAWDWFLRPCSYSSKKSLFFQA